MVCALSRRLSDTPVHPSWAKVPILGIESCPYMSLHLLYLRWGICALLPIKRFGSWIDPPKSVSSAHAISFPFITAKSSLPSWSSFKRFSRQLRQDLDVLFFKKGHKFLI